MPADKDTAGITVNLGTQLINVAIAVLALSGAFYTFILDKKDATTPFYVFYILVFVFLLVSMFFGSLGIDAVKRNGEKDIWITNQTGKTNWFSWQAIFLVLGIICIGILPFLGKEKKSDDEKMKPLLEQIQKRDSLLIKSMDLMIEQQKINLKRPTPSPPKSRDIPNRGKTKIQGINK
jgi:hypothetical protein